MTVLLLLLPTILSVAALGAHLVRSGFGIVALVVPFVYCLLFIPRGWIARLFQLILVVAAIEWVRTAVVLAMERREAGQPWLRMAIILGAVAAFALFAAGLFEGKTLQRIYPRHSEW